MTEMQVFKDAPPLPRLDVPSAIAAAIRRAGERADREHAFRKDCAAMITDAERKAETCRQRYDALADAERERRAAIEKIEREKAKTYGSQRADRWTASQEAGLASLRRVLHSVVVARGKWGQAMQSWLTWATCLSTAMSVELGE